MTALANDPTLGTTSTVGRYFGIVSVIPSLFFTVWTYLLVASRPWEGPPDFSGILNANPFTFAAIAAALVLVSLVVAVITHPVQFMAVQLMEGYWGPGPVGRAWQERRIQWHLRRRARWEGDRQSAVAEVERLTRDDWIRVEERRASVRLALGGPALEADADSDTERAARAANHAINWADATKEARLVPILSATVKQRVAVAAIGAYPELHSNVMPTRLGNVLRRYESSAGSAVGLDVIAWANHIGLVADAAHNAYLRDQRNGMDLAARMAATCAAMFVVTFLLMWPHGLWLLLGLIPLAGAWVSYRGAVSAAASYGQALTAWLHLNRFRLYEALHLPPVADTAAEQSQNEELDALLLGQPDYDSNYHHIKL